MSMSRTDRRPICANCHWRGPEDAYGDQTPDVSGPTCRRNAPVATGGMMSALRTVWPVVGLNDSCGDFREDEIEF